MASSRRSASDVNILAMLDGLGARPQAKRSMLWYGAGGVLACGLVGTLAWLAHEPATRLDSSMVAGALPPPPALAISTGAPSAPPVATAPPSPAGGATLVTLAAAPAPAPAPLTAQAAPPPRILAAPKRVAALRLPAPKTPAVHPAPARGAVAAAPKRHAPAVKPAPAPAAVDTDVALISAIIQHAANGREAAEDAACGDKACGPRMPARP